MSIADMIVVMDHGKIEDSGAPERIYLKPASKFSATFMGDSNLIKAKVSAKGGHLLTLETPLGQFKIEGESDSEKDLLISLRPEQISLSPQELALGEAKLERKQFLGSHHQGLFKHISGEYLKVQLPQDNSLSIGSSAQLYTQKENLVLLLR
jgi:spermidine/putrescine transport system ATP-binding protein